MYFKSNHAQFLTQDKIQSIFLHSIIWSIQCVFFNETDNILCNVSHYVTSDFILTKFFSFVFILLHVRFHPESLIQPQELSVWIRALFLFFFCHRHPFLLVYMLGESNKWDLETCKDCWRLMQHKDHHKNFIFSGASRWGHNFLTVVRYVQHAQNFLILWLFQQLTLKTEILSYFRLFYYIVVPQK